MARETGNLGEPAGELPSEGALSLAPVGPEPKARAQRRERPAEPSDGSARSSSASGLSHKAGAGKDATLLEFQAAIAEDCLIGGAMIGAVLPLTGLTTMRRGPRLGSAMAKLAARDAAVYKAAVRYLKWRTYSELLTFAAVLSVAAMVDTGRLSPANPMPANLLGEELRAMQEAMIEAERAAAQQQTAPPDGQPAAGGRARRTVAPTPGVP